MRIFQSTKVIIVLHARRSFLFSELPYMHARFVHGERRMKGKKRRREGVRGKPKSCKR